MQLWQDACCDGSLAWGGRCVWEEAVWDKPKKCIVHYSYRHRVIIIIPPQWACRISGSLFSNIISAATNRHNCLLTSTLDKITVNWLPIGTTRSAYPLVFDLLPHHWSSLLTHHFLVSVRIPSLHLAPLGSHILKNAHAFHLFPEQKSNIDPSLENINLCTTTESCFECSSHTDNPTGLSTCSVLYLMAVCRISACTTLV